MNQTQARKVPPTAEDCNGFDLYIEIKQDPRLRHIPIVFVSGRCLLEDQQEGLDAGVADYITKPFKAELVPRLLSHVRHRHMASG